MRKLLSIVLAMVMLAVSSVSAFAYEGPTGGAIPGKAPSYQEQLENFKSKDMRDAFERKYNISAQSRAAITSQIYLEIPYSKQETEYYCVPAAVQMVLKYVDGSSPSQTKLAAAMGTTKNGTPFFNAADYLQQNCSYSYGGEVKGTLAETKAFISYAFGLDVPAILCVKFNKGGNWPYTTNIYHAVLASGQNNGQTTFRVVDPYIKYINANHVGYYNVNATEIQRDLNSLIW